MSSTNNSEFPSFKKALRQKTNTYNSQMEPEITSPVISPRSRLDAIRNVSTLKIERKFVPLLQPVPIVMTYKERLDKILSANYRTIDDARFLYDHLRYTPFCVNFLKEEDYDFNTIVEVLRHLKLEKYNKDAVIIEEGEESNETAYILISGAVSIYRRKQEYYSSQNRIHERRGSIQSNAAHDTEDDRLLNASHLEMPETPLFTKKSNENSPGIPSIFSRPGSVSGSPRQLHGNVEPDLRKIIAERNVIESESRAHSRRGSISDKDAVHSRRGSIEKIQMPLTPTLLMNRKKTRFTTPGDVSEVHSRPVKKSNFQQVSSFFADSTDEVKEDHQDSHRFGNILKILRHEDPNAQFGEYMGDIKEKGIIFGEIALEKSIKRTATIVCKDEVQVLTIKKEYYETISKKHKQQEIEQTAFLFSLVPFLDQVSSHESQREIKKAFRMIEYVRNNFPMTEGEFGDDILLVYEGEVKMTKTIFIQNDDNYGGSDKIAKLFRGKNAEKEEISLGFFGRGSFFGEEILNHKKHENIPYIYTLKVVSDTARIFRVSRIALRHKVPHEVTRQLKANFVEKKEEKDFELLDELTKRKLLVLSEHLDTIPLFVYRDQVNIFVPKTEKINRRIKPVDSLKIIASNYNDEFLQTVTSAFKPKEEQHKQKGFESFRKFSRINFLPSTNEIKPDTVQSPANSIAVKIEKVSHYNSSSKTPKNIDEYLEHVDKKFAMADLTKTPIESLSNVSSFRFEFGSEIEEIIHAKQTKLKKAAPQVKVSNATSPKNSVTTLGFRPSLKKFALPLLTRRNSKKEVTNSLAPITEQPTSSRTVINQGNKTDYQIVSGYTFATDYSENFDSTVLQSMTLTSRSPDGKKSPDIMSLSSSRSKYSNRNNLLKLIAKTKERVRESKNKIEELSMSSRGNTSTHDKGNMVTIGSPKSLALKAPKETKIVPFVLNLKLDCGLK